MIKHLQNRTMNLIYWTNTIIFICLLFLTSVDFNQMFGLFLGINGLLWAGFDKRFNKSFE